MAEKGFGVKEVNLIGASGTPTITSPNNLNLNAVNVAISTNVSVGGTLTVSGNVSVGGTLTYEDVTNIDSVGVITAREGIKIPDSKYAYLGSDNDLEITHTGSNGNINNKTGDLVIRTLGSGDDIFIDAVDDVNIRVQSTDNAITCIGDGAVTLHYDGGAKLATSNTGVTVTGTVAATAFSGSGASLTGIAVTEAPVTDYTVTANGSSAYRFHGGGVDETADDPDLYLIRGQKYRFNNTTGSSHPFALRVSSGGSAYTDGVTGDDEGVQFFTVPYTAPASLVYQCTVHSGMVGNIYISGGDGTYKIVADANPIIELDRGSANNTNINLKYNGTLTGQLSVANEEFQLSTVGSNTDIAFYIQGAKKGYWKDSGELWFGSNNTYIKANQIRFGEAGAAYIDQYTTGQDINFRTSVSSALDTTGMTLKSTGNLAFASGKGIDFSASGGPTNGTTTQDSELLDDYEEGKITFESDTSGITINTTYKGRYTKIGELVTVSGYIVLSSFTSSSNQIRVKMPFTSAANSEGYYTRGVGATFSRQMNFPSNYHNMVAYVGGGENYMRFFMTRNAGGSSDWHQMVHSNLTSNSAIYFNVCYTTTS